MPTYFFHMRRDGKRTSLDAEGIELAGLELARREAVLLAGRMLIDQPDEFWKDCDWTVEVQDDRAVTLFLLRVSSVAMPAVFRF